MDTIKFKKLDPAAIIPSYQTAGAAGFDLHVIQDFSLAGGKTAIIKTGLSVAIPSGYEMQIRPRSGITTKTALRIADSPGTIDSDYRGEIGIIVSNLGSTPVDIVSGMRIAQAVIKEARQFVIEEVDELDETNRGAGGFGSTGTGQ